MEARAVKRRKARKVSKARSVPAVSTSVFLTHLVSALNTHSMEHSLPKISNNLFTSSDKYFSRCLCDVTLLAPLQDLTKEATSFSWNNFISASTIFSWIFSYNLLNLLSLYPSGICHQFSPFLTPHMVSEWCFPPLNNNDNLLLNSESSIVLSAIHYYLPFTDKKLKHGKVNQPFLFYFSHCVLCNSLYYEEI